MKYDKMSDHLKQVYEGHLIKFTNVVKGWQARWFILDPKNGSLQYFLCESDKHERARGSIQLAGAVISPSDEDAYTFTVSPAVGESYKLRAQDTKDRQMWLNRLRMVAEMHTRAIAHNHPPLAPREHRSREGSNNQTTLPSNYGGFVVVEAFTKVAEVLEETQRQHLSMSEKIEELPLHGTGMKSIDSSLLMLKATSQATIICLDQCLGVLRSQYSSLHAPSGSTFHHRQKESGQLSPFMSPILGRISRHQHYMISQTSAALKRRASFTLSHVDSSKLGSGSPVLRPRTTPHSPSPSCNSLHVMSSSNALQGTVEVGYNQLLNVSKHIPFLPYGDVIDSDLEVSDSEMTGKMSSSLHVEDCQRSVIMHVLSHLRLGMDLTRVTLPTFILERRSLLEMYADFLGHPDLFIRIADCNSGEERMKYVVKWYLTCIHIRRNGSLTKKPYNPIIGETFHCSWRVPIKPSGTDNLLQNGAVENKEAIEKGKSYVEIRFTAEQVSHHPPVSAFYVECPSKKLCLNGHIWTKSKFMGVSVGVNFVGDIALTVGEVSECYTLSMPSAYARSVLTDPWVELGGRLHINCTQTGCHTSVVLHTKPFYGGKLHRVTADAKSSCGSTMFKVHGEWDAILEFTYPDSYSEIIDVRKIPFVCHKRVRPLNMQAQMESRRLWHDVTVALSRGDIETATEHKRTLEDHQRISEKERASRGAAYQSKYFYSPAPDHWIYADLPPYAYVVCPMP